MNGNECTVACRSVPGTWPEVPSRPALTTWRGGLLARVVPGGAVAATLLPTVRQRAALRGALTLWPRWARWTVHELNSWRDGWNEPSAWVPVILNSRRKLTYSDSFPDESCESHHGVMAIDLRRGIGWPACQVYNPDVATARNAISSERFCGTARYAPMLVRGERTDTGRTP